MTCKYLREFSKNFEMTLMLLSEAWGTMIHEKTRSKKSRDTPFNGFLPCFLIMIFTYLIRYYSFILSPFFVNTNTDVAVN